jgi:predicted ATPase
LPAPLTSFIGRHGQVVQIRKLVQDCRLLTLTGPPGVGKTRLAIELGRTLAGEFPDGTWLAELASLSYGADVVFGVGSALAVPEPGRPMTALDGALTSSAYEAVALHLRARRAADTG